MNNDAVESALELAVKSAQNLRGGVKAFVLAAVAAESEDDGRGAVVAGGGQKIDLLILTAELCKKGLGNFE